MWGGGYGRAAIPVPQTGFKGPLPLSTSSPAPTIHGLGGPIRRIVGASGVRMWGGGPLWSPVRCLCNVLGTSPATMIRFRSAICGGTGNKESRKANNERYIACGDASDLLAQCAGVLSEEVLLPVCAGGDAGQRICAGRDAGPPASPPGRDSHDGRRGDADHAAVPLQRSTAPERLCRRDRGESRCVFSCRVQAWTPGHLAQRSYSALCASAVPGRTAAGQTAHSLRIHLLYWLTPTSPGEIYHLATK